MIDDVDWRDSSDDCLESMRCGTNPRMTLWEYQLGLAVRAASP
jgi:hypothetical protein